MEPLLSPEDWNYYITLAYPQVAGVAHKAITGAISGGANTFFGFIPLGKACNAVFCMEISSPFVAQ